jgi:hypothetical protein
MTISDINVLARYLVDADTTSLTAAQLLIFVNNAYEDIAGKLIALDTNWNWGDSNYTSYPTGLKTLTSSTEAYQLTGDYASTGINTTTPLLTFMGASVKDVNGNWQTLEHITQWQIQNEGFDPAEFFETDGLPRFYELREDFLVLYPAPDNGVSVTLTNGLKVFFQRNADLFTSAQVSTGTKVPGFAGPYHQILAYKAALPYALKFKPERVNMIEKKIAELERGLMEFYAKRDKSEQPNITMRPISFR